MSENKLKALQSSKSNEWETPQDLFDELNDEFHFTLDPCATKENAKCKLFYDKEYDGLGYSWHGQTVFMNPPYGNQINRWVKKGFEEGSKSDTLVVGLIPARTDTRYWHNFIQDIAEVRFIKGRIKFSGAKYNAPFPSAIVIWR